ncbi:3-dehydrosphinganine reductase [Dissophora globulifera]|uniref:3-dehydrosphinganine reductase n=1 Tax=Dissophora globulifera TaxID=979702 RepID=A0A9P6RRX2_9FUNG|nr:3-dehydrosphinganine reductase [Dissophora globulifera]
MVWSPADLLWSLTNRAQLTVFESICANLFLVLIAAQGLSPVYNLIKGNQFKTKGKHVYVTGGSVGLGRAVAIELAKQGAHVTIVARKEGPLRETIELMKQAVAGRKGKAPAADASTALVEQKFKWISADVTDREQAMRALDEASKPFGGKVPDIIMTCAGTAIPKLFVEAPVEDFEAQMKLNYFGTLYTVHEAVKRMVETGVKGKVVLTASTMGLIGFAGYSSYAPTKYALRGLAECLRNEFLMYGIGFHIYYPGTMFSPGYEVEVRGLGKGHFAVTTDFDTNFLRVASKGVTPSANIGFDYLLGLIAPASLNILYLFGATQFLWETNYKVRNFGKKMVKKD